MRGTYDCSDNGDNRPKVVVRVSFNEAGGYLAIFETTNCSNREDVESRREHDGEYERDTVACTLQHECEDRENERSQNRSDGGQLGAVSKGGGDEERPTCE